MSPSKELEEIGALRERIAGLESELRRSQQASEARFHAMADAAPFMVWMTGLDALFVYFNRSWLEFRGRRLEEETGNGWYQGVQQEHRDQVVQTCLTSFNAQQPFRTQFRIERAGGDPCWVEFSGVPRLENGVFAGFMGTAIDIDARKRGVFTPDEESVRIVFSLTERERQVLVLIADGKSTKEAAAQLGISYKTADSHRSRILEKLGVHETASMVRYAIRSGLIEP